MVEKRHGTDSIDHPGDLLLPFLEDRLSGGDRAMVQEHVNSCKECSHKLQMLEELMAKLKANKDSFCPEPHRLFEFAESGEDPEGRLARHIEHCPLCQKDIAAYRTGCDVAVLPERVHAAYRERFSQSPAKQSDLPRKSFFAGLTEWVSSLFKLPAFAVATVAAAILVVVIIYPRGEIEPCVGLSSVTWKQADDDLAPKSLFAEPKKPRVGVLIYFKGFQKQWDQSHVDALYEALAPVVEGQERAEVLSPAEIRTVLKERSHVSSAKDMAKSLGKDLDLSSAVILEIVSSSNGFRIEGRIVDAASGETIRQKALEAVHENELHARLGGLLASLLESKPKVQ